jgi:hypothetical protein
MPSAWTPIRTHEVDEMIRRRMDERILYVQEFNL